MARDRFLKLLLLSVSSLVVLGLLEIACRLLQIGSPNPHQTEEVGLLTADPDPMISYRLTSGFEGLVYGSFVQINSRGLRELESFGYERHEGVLRILCLGDSVVFGYGVAREKAFPAVIAELLATVNPGNRFEVINAGIPGYNTVQEVRFLEVEGSRYQPDLVLLFFVINDPEGTRVLDTEGHLLPVPEDIWLRLFRRYGSLSPPDTVFHSYNAVRRALMPLTARHRRMVEEAVEYYTNEIFQNPGWNACQQALARLRQWRDDSDTSVVPIILPMLTDFDHHPYVATYERFADACSEAGLAPVDAWPALQSYDADSLRLHPLDGHPGVYGHRVIAELVARELGRQLGTVMK
jgi:lysophospholipase L1-like esterase